MITAFTRNGRAAATGTAALSGDTARLNLWNSFRVEFVVTIFVIGLGGYDKARGWKAPEHWGRHAIPAGY